MKPYVYITRKISEQALQPLQEVAEVGMWDKEDALVPREVLEQEASRATALFTLITDRIDAALLNHAPHLKVVANMAVGYDNIDVTTATNKKIIICHTPDVLTDTTADLTFALLMATARRIVEAADFIREDQWSVWSPLLLAGHDIHHKTIGIVGMGRIGETVAKRATGFDMNILYHNRTRKPEAERNLNATYCSLDELIAKSDFVVSLAPLTDETKEMFNESVFSRMKKTAIFINASRGGLVDEGALYRALINRDIAGAGLDVFAEEPISSAHPLLSLKNVVAIPHIGSASIETRIAMAKMTSENIAHVLRGETAKAAVVNKTLLSL